MQKKKLTTNILTDIYYSPPYGFKGNKSNQLFNLKNIFNEIIDNDGEGWEVIDVFGGSLYCSHVAKRLKPKARVITNDYESYYQTVMRTVKATFETIRRIEDNLVLFLIDNPDLMQSCKKDYKSGLRFYCSGKINPEQYVKLCSFFSEQFNSVNFDEVNLKQIVSRYFYKGYCDFRKGMLENLAKDPKNSNYVFYFSCGAVLKYKEQQAKGVVFENMSLPYRSYCSRKIAQAEHYVDGIEIDKLDAFDFMDKYTSNHNAKRIVILDPPYTNTDQTNYLNSWTDEQQANLLARVRKPFIICGSTKSGLLTSCYFASKFSNEFLGFKDAKASYNLSRGRLVTPEDFIIYNY